jgi:hypothetical protein
VGHGILEGEVQLYFVAGSKIDPPESAAQALRLSVDDPIVWTNRSENKVERTTIHNTHVPISNVMGAIAGNASLASETTQIVVHKVRIEEIQVDRVLLARSVMDLNLQEVGGVARGALAAVHPHEAAIHALKAH